MELTFSGAQSVDLDALKLFFRSIALDESAKSFHPHSFSDDEASRIHFYSGKDAYIIGLSRSLPVAYGLLRGWDEGFEIPSLGIYLEPTFRGKGNGRALMKHLHELAKFKGSRQVRLKVYRGNGEARRLYESLGYKFSDPDAASPQIVGLLAL